MMMLMMIGVDPGFPVGFMIRLVGCYRPQASSMVTECHSCHSGTRYTVEGGVYGLQVRYIFRDEDR